MSHHSSPRQNQGNKIGSVPCVRMSKLYREKESGNSMKGILGVDHLAWDTDQQQGAFNGMPVYDAASENMPRNSAFGAPSQWGGSEGLHPQHEQQHDIEYPQPGSRATCEACEQVVDRYYHCRDCVEEDGVELFDLCSRCCVSAYVASGNPLPPHVHAALLSHPHHDMQHHQMVQVAPP